MISSSSESKNPSMTPKKKRVNLKDIMQPLKEVEVPKEWRYDEDPKDLFIKKIRNSPIIQRNLQFLSKSKSPVKLVSPIC